MVPEAAVLVVGDHDRGGRPLRSRLDGFDEVDEVLIPEENVRVAGVLVLLAEGLDERHRWQCARSGLAEEVAFVLKMRASGSILGVVRVIVERLVSSGRRWAAAEVGEYGREAGCIVFTA